MLLQFTVSNFRVFKGTQRLNLGASNYDKALPQNIIAPALPGLKNQRWLRGAAIYGANASGKSSVIEALGALKEFVTESAKTTDRQDPITCIEPFALAPDIPAPPTGFGIVFVSDDVRFEYRVAATRQQVWHESLRAFPSGREQLWFSRDWNPDTKHFTWTSQASDYYQLDAGRRDYTLPNVLFLSKAISLGDSQLEPIFRFFKDNLRFLDLSSRTGLQNGFTAEQLLKVSHLAPQIVQLLRHADLGIVNAKVREEEPDADMLSVFKEVMGRKIPESELKDLKVQQIELLHRGPNSTEIALPWQTESAGTHRFFALAGPWLDILNNGYTVCIDELETSMHPLMVEQLLRLIFNDRENRSNAQVIFTTHNPLLLDPTLLRRDQVWFTDKTDAGESHLYPLTDYKPRSDESLIRGYMAGRYGGIPFIPKGLCGSFSSVETIPPASKKTRSDKKTTQQG